MTLWLFPEVNVKIIINRELSTWPGKISWRRKMNFEKIRGRQSNSGYLDRTMDTNVVSRKSWKGTPDLAYTCPCLSVMGTCPIDGPRLGLPMEQMSSVLAGWRFSHAECIVRGSLDYFVYLIFVGNPARISRKILTINTSSHRAC